MKFSTIDNLRLIYSTFEEGQTWLLSSG